jgi:hypothetical protein
MIRKSDFLTVFAGWRIDQVKPLETVKETISVEGDPTGLKPRC